MIQDPQALRSGTILNGPQRSYKIIKKLGQGGFGITYLAEAKLRIDNITVTVRFAIKEHFISSLSSRDAATQHVTFSQPVAREVTDSMRAFIKEAQRLQGIRFAHPNVVNINEVFEANNTAYFVMEYLEGETLDSYIARRGALSFDKATALLRPVAEAVAELHGRRMAHYDIKPANIILARDDESGRVCPVLIDFGLAKHYDKDGVATSRRSQNGYTPGYSPIEQYAGIKTFTPAADAYALGATLWYCLVGEAPPEAITAPVSGIDTALGGALPPKALAGLRHAMAPLEAERTTDASAFVSEVFDGGITSIPTQRRRPTDADDVQPTVHAEEQPSPARRKWMIAIVAAVIIGIAIPLIISKIGSPATDPEQQDSLASSVIDIIEESLADSIPNDLADVVDEIMVADSIPLEDKPDQRATPMPISEHTEDAVLAQSPAPQATVEVTTAEPTQTTSQLTVRLRPITGRPSEPTAPKDYGRRSYNAFDLCTTRDDGAVRYFTVNEWKVVPASEKSRYTKKGVVVMGGYVPAGKDDIFSHEANSTAGYASDFLVELNDNGKGIKWDEAISLYGNRLPTIYHVYCMAKNMGRLNGAIRDFGGDSNPRWRYWTRTEYDSAYAWYVSMNGGGVNNTYKYSTYRVRAVAPVPTPTAD